LLLFGGIGFNRAVDLALRPVIAGKVTDRGEHWESQRQRSILVPPTLAEITNIYHCRVWCTIERQHISEGWKGNFRKYRGFARPKNGQAPRDASLSSAIANCLEGIDSEVWR
jgi:hypothetical protein